MTPRRIVILTQVYIPDPASVGQHMHDLAAALVARGHEVIVYCSSRGYDDGSRRYVRNETRDGVIIRRYALPLFSKSNMLLRVIGSAWAQAALFLNALFTPRASLLFYSTSPPLIGVTATIVAKLKSIVGRRVPLAYWAMDLNPDQLIAMGKIKPSSLIHRILESANRFILRNADLTIPLDRFMDARLLDAGRQPRKLAIIPPWPHEKAEQPLAHSDNSFRDRHGLQGKFVVMYSGNHSPANPLDTLLAATLAFKDDETIRFAFVGGGAGKRQVTQHIEKHALTHCLDLPYQPLADLRYSLSAADVHVVSLGADMVGIIHPCKVYGAMAVGRPILFLGPRPSHVADLLDAHSIGWHVTHGDVEACIRTLREMKSADALALARMGDRAQTALRSNLSQEILCGTLCDEIELLLTA